MHSKLRERKKNEDLLYSNFVRVFNSQKAAMICIFKLIKMLSLSISLIGNL